MPVGMHLDWISLLFITIISRASIHSITTPSNSPTQASCKKARVKYTTFKETEYWPEALTL